ncbi:protein giant-lens-like [Portunus trituberculatus]|uniref:protein giant-lens-like n=1 Tax=Portunus trituberculatus TaxID=210409 RepID=UPI001E1CBEBB|nr:protein giant-lens-like [Portunus trituberculatus]
MLHQTLLLLWCVVVCVAPTPHPHHHHPHHHHYHHHTPPPPPLSPSFQDFVLSSKTRLVGKLFYPEGMTEESLPQCSPREVCNKVDTYGEPRVERQCRCGGGAACHTSLDEGDGHTVLDKTRQYKVCEPVDELPRCRYFHDITWTLVTAPDNTTKQLMQCRCPQHAVAYIIKRHAYKTPKGPGFVYSFACSPESRLRCQRKEPCRLFTVKKRPEFEKVNTNTLCRCPHGHTCPDHHLSPGVLAGKTYAEDAMRTYSGYCI